MQETIGRALFVLVFVVAAAFMSLWAGDFDVVRAGDVKELEFLSHPPRYCNGTPIAGPVSCPPPPPRYCNGTPIAGPVSCPTPPTNVEPVCLWVNHFGKNVCRLYFPYFRRN